MGDAGSMLLGFFVAVMISLFSSEGPLRWTLAACVVFALPIFDTSLAVVRHVISHKNIFEGDRSHLYDQLVDRGMSVKRVVLLFYILSVLAAIVGNVGAIYLRFRYALVIYVLLFLAVWVVFVLNGMVNPDKNKKNCTK
jgi:UDP-GlcNAc:undecaprenyl-phosphate GlcNAc-1-phosphate transferase